MKTFVTGASGHLGANLVRALLDRGEEVRVLVRPGSDNRGVENIEVEHVVGDLRDKESLRKAVAGCDRIYNCAAFLSLRTRDVELIHEINVVGTRNLLEICLDHGVERVVHCSSFGAMALNPRGASDESWYINPFEDAMPYERSKYFAEHEALKAVIKGLDVVIVNPTGIVGPWDYKPSNTGRTILEFAHGKLKAYVEGSFDFVPAEAVVQGHIAAMEQGRTGERYLLSGTVASLGEILGWLQEFTGKPKPRLKMPAGLMKRIAPVKDWVEDRFFPEVKPRFTRHTIRLLSSGKHGDNTKARKELGFDPKPLKEAFREHTEWFYSHGFIQ